MSKKFEIHEVVDLTEDAMFSLIDENYDNQGMLVIKEEKLTIYFESGEIKEFDSDYETMLQFVHDRGLKFIKLQNGNHRWKKYNPNPKNRKTGDCTIRAYCAAFGLPWAEAYNIASDIAREEGFILDATQVVKKILIEGFNCTPDDSYKRKKGKDSISVNHFAMTHPYGTYIVHTRGHLVTVKDGEYWDSWDSGEKKIDAVYNI